MKDRMQIYAEALQKAIREQQKTTDALSEKLKDLEDDEMLVIPIGESHHE